MVLFARLNFHHLKETASNDVAFLIFFPQEPISEGNGEVHVFLAIQNKIPLPVSSKTGSFRIVILHNYPFKCIYNLKGWKMCKRDFLSGRSSGGWLVLRAIREIIHKPGKWRRLGCGWLSLADGVGCGEILHCSRALMPILLITTLYCSLAYFTSS